MFKKSGVPTLSPLTPLYIVGMPQGHIGQCTISLVRFALLAMKVQQLSSRFLENKTKPYHIRSISTMCIWIESPGTIDNAKILDLDPKWFKRG